MMQGVFAAPLFDIILDTGMVDRQRCQVLLI